MIFADRDEFDRAHYEFKFIRREFLGDVRTLVFDITRRRTLGTAASWAAYGWKKTLVALCGA